MSHKISEVVARTGLQEAFVRRVVREIPEPFKGEVERGEHNALLFSSTAMVLMDQVAQMKAENLSLPAIAKHLTETCGTYDNKNQTIDIQGNKVQVSLEEFIGLKARVAEVELEKERQVGELRRENETLAVQLRMLTDGRDPETIRLEREKAAQEAQETAQRRAQIIGELKGLGMLSWIRRKKLLDELATLG